MVAREWQSSVRSELYANEKIPTHGWAEKKEQRQIDENEIENGNEYVNLMML